MGRYTEASNEFKHVLTNIYKDDTYCFVGLANVAFKNALIITEPGSAVARDPNACSEQDRLMVKAYNKYLDILVHDQSNSYAAVGVANALAFFNKVDDASEIYKIVAQATPHMYQPVLN